MRFGAHVGYRASERTLVVGNFPLLLVDLRARRRLAGVHRIWRVSTYENHSFLVFFNLSRRNFIHDVFVVHLVRGSECEIGRDLCSLLWRKTWRCVSNGFPTTVRSRIGANLDFVHDLHFLLGFTTSIVRSTVAEIWNDVPLFESVLHAK